MRFFLFGSLSGQKRRARDIDLVVELEEGETVDAAMRSVEEIAPRVRKPIELWLSRSETQPNLAGNYDYRSGRWAFWRRPGMPGFFRGSVRVSLRHVVKLALTTGPYGPVRRGTGTEASAGPECTVWREADGWWYRLGDQEATRGPFRGPLEAAGAAQAQARAMGELSPAQVLWFRLAS